MRNPPTPALDSCASWSPAACGRRCWSSPTAPGAAQRGRAGLAPQPAAALPGAPKLEKNQHGDFVAGASCDCSRSPEALVGAENPFISRGLGILVDQPAESIQPHDPFAGCWIGFGDGSDRWRLTECAVRPVLVAGSARGAVPAFRRARFPGPPSEPDVSVVPAPGSPRGPSPNRRLRCRSAPQYPACTARSGRRYSPAAPALPTRYRSLAVPLRHVHASRVLGLLRALRHDPPPPADDAPARRPAGCRKGRATTGRLSR